MVSGELVSIKSDGIKFYLDIYKPQNSLTQFNVTDHPILTQLAEKKSIHHITTLRHTNILPDLDPECT
jgi:hypothetical protein